MRKLTLQTAFLLLIPAASAWAGTIDFSLLPPSGAIGGSPGSVIGWGYSITNNTADWALPTGLSAGIFPGGVTPVDIFDFPEIGPGDTVTLAYSAILSGMCSSTPCGLYELDLGAAPIGPLIGIFDISVDLYDGDPLNGGQFVSSAPDLTASYTANVQATPEPGTLLEVLAALGAFAAWKKRRTAAA